MHELRTIGIIRSPFPKPQGTPIQPLYADRARGRILVNQEYADALEDIEGFDRIWLVYLMHLVSSWKPRVIPFRDTREHGLFATRSPSRPNPIGLSSVELLSRDGNCLEVAGIDVVDGTPLLDIKPYVPDFDAHPKARSGWFAHGDGEHTVADGRFAH
jgi:tRNA-Thr(GGU) m(6)t(6)A37 methyltransferase TsaA